MKKLPNLSKVLMRNTSKPRQSWRQQLQIMEEWAKNQDAWLEAKRRREVVSGR